MRFSPRIPRPTKTIGVKIAAGYSILFACSFVVLAIFAYLLLESALARQDRRMIVDEVQSLQDHYRSGGWAAFSGTVIANDRFRKNNPFFTRVLPGAAKDGRIFFPQYWADFDLSVLERLPGQAAGQWTYLPNRTHTYELEILTARHVDGGLFQVGISTEDRMAVLAHYKEAFLAVSLPLTLLAVGGGALFSHRVLNPLRNLINIVASIDAGKMDARVRVAHTGDELDELGSLFNRMIEKIDQLIQGMKNSLDIVAHDLRTPMTRFRNVAEAALQQKRTAEAYREALQECMDESDRILAMLNMLMDISEAEAGTMRLRLQYIDLVPLTEEIVDMYRYVGDEKAVAIKTDFPPEALLRADADRIRQVLANLLDNAVKFSAAGAEVSVSIVNSPDWVQVQIADSGPGIRPEAMGRIWDRLYRDPRAAHKGLGLGLSVVKAVVKAHSGDIQVASPPGAGTTFTLRLPVHTLSMPPPPLA